MKLSTVQSKFNKIFLEDIKNLIRGCSKPFGGHYSGVSLENLFGRRSLRRSTTGNLPSIGSAKLVQDP